MHVCMVGWVFCPESNQNKTVTTVGDVGFFMLFCVIFMGQKLMMIKKHWEHLSKGGSGKVWHYSALKL